MSNFFMPSVLEGFHLPPDPFSTFPHLALGPGRLLKGTEAIGSLSLWLPVGGGPWGTLAGDQLQGVVESLWSVWLVPSLTQEPSSCQVFSPQSSLCLGSALLNSSGFRVGIQPPSYYHLLGRPSPCSIFVKRPFVAPHVSMLRHLFSIG